MAKRTSTTKTPTRKRPSEGDGRAGPMGPAGPPGAPGPAGPNHTNEISRLTAQVEQLVKELQTQLTRIGQIQAQLDHMVTGRGSESRNRRSTDRTEH